MRCVWNALADGRADDTRGRTPVRDGDGEVREEARKKKRRIESFVAWRGVT
jgi:hypothetical protein